MSVAVDALSVEVPLWSRGVVDLINRPVFLADGQRFSHVSSVQGDEVFTADDPSRALTGDAVVALPVLGEFVRTHDGTQDVSGYWLGLVREAAQQGRLEAFVLEESRVRLVSFEPLQVEARQVVSGRATEGERVAMSALLVEAGAHERTKREHKDRLERLVDAAHEEADERNWCFEFDDFLEAQGLPRRSHDYQLRVEVTATVYVSRDATSEDNAIDSLTTQEVFGLLTVQNIEYEASED